MDFKSSVDPQTHHGFVGDVQQLQSMKTGKGAQTREGLLKVAQEFESMYLKMMLDSMRKAEKVWAKDNPFGSREQDMFRDMLDGQLSKELSAQGSLGLADMLMRQLSPHVKDTSHSSALKSESIPAHQKTLNLQQSNVQQSKFEPQMSNAEVENPIESYPAQQFSLQTENPENREDINVADFAGHPDRFTEVVMPYAVEAGQKLGVDPKLLVAQAALETGWGRSLKQDQHGFNMFGIKAGGSWGGKAQEHLTSEVYDGQTLKQRASFRAYDSIQQSFDDYVALVQTRYASAQAQGSNPASYVEQLSAHGYATDPLYADKVLSVYQSDRLQQADLPRDKPVRLAQLEPQLLLATDPRLQIW